LMISKDHHKSVTELLATYLVSRELVFGLHPLILENALVTRYHLGLFQRFLYKKRLEILHSPKGPPPREYLVFIKRHTGIYWPVYFLELYMRVLFPRLWRLFGK
jgi:hypothetical protein